MVEKSKYEKRYEWARMAVLLAVICTVVNLILPIVDTVMSSILLVPASAPTSLTLPEIAVSTALAVETTDGPLYLTILCSAAAVLLLTAYVLCLVFSKRRVGWMIAALILVLVDTLGLIAVVVTTFLTMDGTPDLWNILLRGLFQAALLYFIITGLVGWKKRYKK